MWARSVTFLPQKQYNGTPTFKDWYESQQNALQADPLAKFFKDQRNFVLKERSVSVGKVINVTMHAHIVMEATLTVKVIRGSWRSKIRYLRQDSLRDLKQRIEKIRRRLRRRKLEQEPTTTVSTEHMYFVEEPWNKEPVIDLLNRYLERLQLLVDNTVEQFTVTVENQ